MPKNNVAANPKVTDKETDNGTNSNDKDDNNANTHIPEFLL